MAKSELSEKIRKQWNEQGVCLPIPQRVALLAKNLLFSPPDDVRPADISPENLGLLDVDRDSLGQKVQKFSLGDEHIVDIYMLEADGQMFITYAVDISNVSLPTIRRIRRDLLYTCKDGVHPDAEDTRFEMGRLDGRYHVFASYVQVSDENLLTELYIKRNMVLSGLLNGTLRNNLQNRQNSHQKLSDIKEDISPETKKISEIERKLWKFYRETRIHFIDISPMMQNISQDPLADLKKQAELLFQLEGRYKNEQTVLSTRLKNEGEIYWHELVLRVPDNEELRLISGAMMYVSLGNNATVEQKRIDLARSAYKLLRSVGFIPADVQNSDEMLHELTGILGTESGETPTQMPLVDDGYDSEYQ